MKKKSAAVTEAVSGLGLEIILSLALKGFKVFGTAFSASDVSGFKSTAPAAKITHTVCDIAKEEDVKNWARIVTFAVSDSRIDLLINNAAKDHECANVKCLNLFNNYVNWQKVR